ncbi:MAG: hypothetical protein L0H64_22910 [Pseudonocardia sp.]|nr:hypothetical protein [Pseudonocardia sp.]
MPGRPVGPQPDEPQPDEPQPEPDGRRAATLSEADRRRIDAVFGDVLPSTTSDERGPGSAPEDPDAALLADRPPHHDRGG